MNLKRYIEQLTGDMAEAVHHVPNLWEEEYGEGEEEYGLLPWMEDIDNAPSKSLEEWTGIRQEQLPPAHMLNDREIRTILKFLKNMLDAYNCSAVFQIDVPPRLQYQVIRERFFQEVPLLKANYFFFKFCDDQCGTAECSCPLGKYCECRFFEQFFKQYSLEAEEETEEVIDPYEEYMLRRRYGEDWENYLEYEEELDFEDFDEDDFGFEDFDEDDMDIPF